MKKENKNEFSFSIWKKTAMIGLNTASVIKLMFLQSSLSIKPHLHGRLFCNAIRRFFMRQNISRRAVTHTRQDSLAAIAFEKNRCRVSNTCDLRCRLYFARLDATIVLARDHLHEVDFNVSRVPGRSRARVNSKSYAIYESPRHSAMHKCFASRWLRLS